MNYDTDTASARGFIFGNGGGNLPLPPGNTEGTALLAYLHQTTFTNNVYFGQWSNSNPAGYVDMTASAVTAASALYPPAPGTFWPNAGSTMASRAAGIHWNNPAQGDMRLNYLSPYVSGGRASSDGLDVGVNMDDLQAAQGKVSNAHVYAITSSTATVSFLAPDAAGCTVDYGTANFPSGAGGWTRMANSGGQRVQNVALSGLAAATTYTYRVNCAVVQPTGTFKTR